MKFSENFNKRRLKYGSLATALTVFVVAAIVLVNIVATMLFDRFPITLDLTSGSIYSASQETIDYISKIESPVRITVLATEEEFRSISAYTAQCTELMKNYTQYNSGITLRFVDMLSNPDFVANYSESLQRGDIIVELDNGEHDRVKVISLLDIVVVYEGYEHFQTPAAVAYYGSSANVHSVMVAMNYVKSSNAEQALTSAIMAVTDANPIHVAVLYYPGANESNISGLTDLLNVNGYMLENLQITTDELTDDIDLIIIPAPKIDYSTAEIQKIENWLAGGGMLEKDMIYVASSEQQETPNLDGLLYKYGLTIEYKIIHETSTAFYSGKDTYTFQNIATENYLQDMTTLKRAMVVADARPITTRFENVDSTYSCEPLIASASSAVLKDMFDPDEDWTADKATERGSFNTAVIGKQKKINQDTHIPTYTYVIAFGSDLILDPMLTKSSSYNNGDFAISLINAITGKTEGITIKPKVISNDSFNITEAQNRTLTLTFVVIIPVAVLALGTFIWLRRRHK